jgi:hypothetical protein
LKRAGFDDRFLGLPLRGDAGVRCGFSFRARLCL